MSAGAEPVLFEAISTPPRSLSDRGMAWLCALAGLGAALPAGLFLLLGAWPVLGFLGIEVTAVLFLVALHRRWSAAAVETVRLTEGRLRIACADGRGGRMALELDPYWTRLEVRERPDGSTTLRLVSRNRGVEVGRYLAPAEKHDLAGALGAALRRYRNPVFDNPQLRD